MRPSGVTSVLDTIETTAEIPVPRDPFERIIGQEHAVSLIRSAVTQRRHILLCGVPGIGKSMLAQAAYTLLSVPREEIRLRPNSLQPDRPCVIVIKVDCANMDSAESGQSFDTRYVRPEEVPFEIAIKMGYRCSRCGNFSTPSQSVCMDCGSPKRCDWPAENAYHGLFQILDVVGERALTSVKCTENIDDTICQVEYRRTNRDSIMVLRERNGDSQSVVAADDKRDYILVARNSSRFVRASGTSPVELLGDVKHDPYGSAESLGMPAHMRVVPGAIHEAHEGILYLDEIASLGPYQKHLLTAMQERKYSISGHNPQSSGAAVRVDNVPCDFLLFASCNPEDLPQILPALRSRIRGYGYEVMLSSYTPKTPENIDRMVRFIAQTVQEDGRIPHLTAESVQSVLKVSEDIAYRLDGQREALTLRMRELGGLIRVAGDFAVRDRAELIMPVHVREAEAVLAGVDTGNTQTARLGNPNPPASEYTSYFF
ncbi:MAG: peptidase [Candidatus Thorarchaeota archaeon]|nr:MAG: peptidase [Candidatus Thorarchaeota archaeon]